MLDIQNLERKIIEHFKNVSKEQFEKASEKAMNSPCPICGKHLAKDCKIKLFAEEQ